MEEAHGFGTGTLMLAMAAAAIVAAVVTFVVVEHHNTASTSTGVSCGQYRDNLVLALANPFPPNRPTGSASDLHPSELAEIAQPYRDEITNERGTLNIQQYSNAGYQYSSSLNPNN